MELNFLCWMCAQTLKELVPTLSHAFHRFCLEQLQIVQDSDHVALVTRVFWK